MTTLLRQVSGFITLTLALCLHPVAAQDRIASLAGDGGVLLHSPSGEVLVSYNPDLPLIPASIVKIPLSQAALKILGEDFRFETTFYTNEAGDLLIRGLGDPFLVSEEVAIIADTLHQRGLREVRRIMVDDSAFEPRPDLPLELGANDPYAARVSALAVNFNTVNLAWATDGAVITGEEQTPLTPLARELAATLRAGEPQRINLGSDPEKGLQQVQQIFRLMLEGSGVTVSESEFAREQVNDDWKLFYRHRSSRALPEILRGMLRYSNNFIANQLFLTLAGEQRGYPATVANARAVLQQELEQLYGTGFGIDPQRLLTLEGSGLSREQRVSAAGMLQILETFEPHADLISETNDVLRKSGTLTGVYNYAGYIPGPEGLHPFVILTNQGVNNRDEILRELRSRL